MPQPGTKRRIAAQLIRDLPRRSLPQIDIPPEVDDGAEAAELPPVPPPIVFTEPPPPEPDA